MTNAALHAFLSSVYAEASEFAFDPTRFGRAYRELESVVYEGRALSTLVAPVHGLELDSGEVLLAEGFALVRGDTLPELPAEAVWEGGLPNVVAVVAVEDPGLDAAVERRDPFDSLSDWLLALRVLLEPEGPASGRLAQRLAAICALPDDRARLAERVAHAVSLERAVMRGIAPAGPGAEELCEELGDHLRALLRDVICGHLDADLVSVAEDLLDEAITDEHPVLSAEPVG